MSILLHSCCAPCSTEVIERLGRDDVVVLFYNPNIYPEAEYRKRLCEEIRLCDELGVSFVEGPYDADAWLAAVKGLEQEPENRKRCRVCYRFRLEHTARYAKEHGLHAFATTLTISPHKKAEMINPIGIELGEKYGVEFLAEDFKKRAGFENSVRLSKEHSLYRQHYCGCVFSMGEPRVKNDKK